ncbi:hypothetical protein DERP_013764 [Dermatophagoides pteronyssinus]|uniref:Uncharacterized protein n=1 Tax=Dermatophagoides pteronyssinus TaxID=6956 RepID=A0ABQ8JG03_DERPT|nr:hypothetical protein DERP_013764 [Dermatophagoides pteronyssinus]
MWVKILKKHQILMKEALIRQQQNQQQVNGNGPPQNPLPAPQQQHVNGDGPPQNPLPAPDPIGGGGRFPLMNGHQHPPAIAPLPAQPQQQVNGIRLPMLRDGPPQNPLPAPDPIGGGGRFPLINGHQHPPAITSTTTTTSGVRFPLINGHQQPPPVVAQVAPLPPQPQQPPMQQPSPSVSPPPSPGSDASSLSAYTPSPPNSPQPISEQSTSALRSSPARQRSPPSSPPPTSRRRLMTDNLQPQPIPGPSSSSSGQQLPSNLIQNPTNTERSDLQEIANLVNDLIGNISKTGWDMVRYPYKTVYGLPKSLQCSESVYHQFNECEKASHREWKVTIDEYFYETKEFCCFVWHAMACEIEIAAKCNRNYSQQIETNTRQLFTSVCDKIRSSQRSWNCFWTEDMKIIAGVVVTVITVLLVVVGAYIGCRQYRANAKQKAQVAEQFKNRLKSEKIKLTTEEIVPSKDLRSISSTTSTNADHLDKPIELSEWSPQIPKKINIQHVGAEPNDFNIFPNENRRLQPIEQKIHDMWVKILEKHQIFFKELIRQQQNQQQVNGIRLPVFIVGPPQHPLPAPRPMGGGARFPLMNGHQQPPPVVAEVAPQQQVNGIRLPVFIVGPPQHPLPAPRPIGGGGRFQLMNGHQQPPPVVAEVAPQQQVNGIRLPVFIVGPPQHPLPAPRPIGGGARFQLMNGHQQPPPVVAEVAPLPPPPQQQPPMPQSSPSASPPPSPGSDASSLSAYTPSPPNSPQPISEQSTSALRSSPVRQRSPPSSPPPTSRRRLMTDNLQQQPIPGPSGQQQPVPGPSGQQLPSNLIQNPTNNERSDLQEIANLVNDLIGHIIN